MAIKIKNYYEILEVKQDACEKEIHRAFRRLARKHHPDVNPEDSRSEERFKEINEAYEALGDPKRRKRCDWQMGEELTPAPVWTKDDCDLEDFGISFILRLRRSIEGINHYGRPVR